MNDNYSIVIGGGHSPVLIIEAPILHLNVQGVLVDCRG